MGFNPLSPTTWGKKKKDGSREVAETMPLCLSPVEADSPENPDASEGLWISGHSQGLCQQLQKSHIGGYWSPGAWLYWDSDPEIGLGCLGCGGETGAGRADLRENVLWTKNGQNKIVSHGKSLS